MLTLRRWDDSLIWTNLPLFAVAGLFNRVHASILVASAVASCLYHRHAELRFLALDRACAMAAFASSLLLMSQLAVDVLTLALGVDILLAFVTLRLSNFRRREKTYESAQYHTWHTAWHVFIVVGQLLLACASYDLPPTRLG